LTREMCLSYFYSNSAIYLSKRGEAKSSERNYALAEKCWPKNPVVIKNKFDGLVYKKPAEAIGVLSQTDEEYWNSDFYAGLGLAAMNMGKNVESMEYLERAIRMNAFNANAYFLKAAAYLNQGEATEAELPLLQAIRVLSENVVKDISDVRQAHTKEIDCYASVSQSHETERILLRIYDFLILVELSLGKLDKAMACCNEAIFIQPENANLLELKALTTVLHAEVTGDKRTANQLFSEAIAICDRILAGNYILKTEVFEVGADKAVDHERIQHIRDFARFKRDGVKPNSHRSVSSRYVLAISLGLPENAAVLFAQIYYVKSGKHLDIDQLKNRLSTFRTRKGGYRSIRIRSLSSRHGFNGFMPQKSRKAQIQTKAFSSAHGILTKNSSINSGIYHADISEEERGLLMGLWQNEYSEPELECFIAVNHRLLMERNGKPFSQEYLDFHRQVFAVPGKISYARLIGLAKMGLGDSFEVEMKKVKEALHDDPLSIDRTLLKAAVPYALSNLPKENDLTQLAKSYLLHVGKVPTDQAVAEIKPQILKSCKENMSIAGKSVDLNPNTIKFR